jgi:hypothetical protein
MISDKTQPPVQAESLLPKIPFAHSPNDTIAFDQFLLEHAFSLDHFMEALSGIVLRRYGPIGADAPFSRYGIGSGRGTVYLAGVPINDPQNDIAPLALVPTTSVQTLVLNNSDPGVFFGRSGLEGSIQIVERNPRPDRPYTAFELSKGRYDLRQRRVRFASAQSTLGIDLGYDELLHNGYPYDEITGALSFGRSRTRFQTANIRGELPNKETYFLSFRWFRDTFLGDVRNLQGERRRSGHYAIASSTLRSWRFTLFERGYDVSLPDSHTVNHTTAVYATVRPYGSESIDSELGFSVEDIHSQQVIAGCVSKPTLRRAAVGGKTVFRGWGDVLAKAEFTAGYHLRGKAGWGAGGSVFFPLADSHQLSLDLAKSFRLPNLGERFLPLHAAGTSGRTRIVGNRYLDPENLWEAGIRLRSKLGFFENETRLRGFRAEDRIHFHPREIGEEIWLIADNGDGGRLGLLEEYCSVQGSIYGSLIRLSGSVAYAFGEREDYFSAVPEVKATASFSIRRDLFRSTSSILLASEFQYSDSHRVFPGADSPPFGALNLKLDARLLDAHLYLLWLNVFDRNFRINGPQLLTPRTLVYGVQWTIFN